SDFLGSSSEDDDRDRRRVFARASRVPGGDAGGIEAFAALSAEAEACPPTGAAGDRPGGPGLPLSSLSARPGAPPSKHSARCARRLRDCAHLFLAERRIVIATAASW